MGNDREQTAVPDAAGFSSQAAPGESRAGRSTILPRITVSGAELELKPRATNRFEALDRLGEGAAGEVALVRDNDIHRLVAVKTLKSDRHDADSLARFVEEVRIIGQLEHPNIAPLHDVGVDEHGHYYFVMKYVDGESLESIIDKLAAGDEAYHKRFTFEYRVLVFRDVLRAMEYAHARGIIHRDIKPANIIVGPNGEATVMDWGLAKKVPRAAAQPVATPSAALETQLDGVERRLAAERESTGHDSTARVLTTHEGAILGTPAYMSPEQAMGSIGDVDQRSDIYSLSAVFYKFLTLRHYIAIRTDLKEMLRAVLYEEPVEAVAQCWIDDGAQPGVPRELSLIAQRGLAKDPAQRFQNVSEMLAELQTCAEGRVCVVCPNTLVKRGLTVVRHGLDSKSKFGTAVTLSVVFGTLVLALSGLVQLLRRPESYTGAVLVIIVVFMLLGSLVGPRSLINATRARNRKRGIAEAS